MAAAAAPRAAAARASAPAAVGLRVAYQLGRNVLLAWKWKAEEDDAAASSPSKHRSPDETQPKSKSNADSSADGKDAAKEDGKEEEAWKAQIRFNGIELGEESLAGGEPWYVPKLQSP
eukprot:516840-Rhodomonas_salina.10